MLGPRIAAAIRAEQGTRACWEPFCGGLGVTRALAKGSVGFASDLHPALIATYLAVREGWQPPFVVTDRDYAAARVLPDCDPRKGFVGFFCSFSGKYFGGLARDPSDRNYASEAACSLVAAIAETRHWYFDCESFFTRKPKRAEYFLYCDPPYAGTTRYTLPFAHAEFWQRCQHWARYVPVYVSEFACPVRHRTVLTIQRGKGCGGPRTPCNDLLVQVLP